ncbi:MAG TPA: exo-beta-N-acetylmuramidase NamZ domain-containing protein [Candidatus Acidoferrum sp.]|nr:exo-beta-N-acetylmuramidase NamZ domain-containing protein [Candidatus Acidoferrum sp.]
MKNSSARFPTSLSIWFACFFVILTPPTVFARNRGLARPVTTTAVTSSAASDLAGIAPLVEEAIRNGATPGAVVEIGHDGRIVYRRAFGNRTLLPHPSPMTVDTRFDLASLTKVIATTPAVMQLFEKGRIRLDDPVAAYWPAFGNNGKQDITVRELMTHYSGLPPDLPLEQPWQGYDNAMSLIVDTEPLVPPGTRFIYSDINFETLGELVRRISGEPLDIYCQQHIFGPLGMTHTLFKPPARLQPDMAPTQPPDQKNELVPWYQVNDGTSFRMGGVAGHAGLFSTAGDLAIYAQMILDGGVYRGVRVLSPPTVLKMTTPQTPVGEIAVRGLGWDIDTAFSSNRGELFPVGSFGHTGFTGTSIWIDPFSNTFVIILTNAVHAGAHGNVIPLRAKIATLVAAAYAHEPDNAELTRRASSTGYFELLYGFRPPRVHDDQVRTGIDVLEAGHFTGLTGKRIGLITNQSGRDLSGRRTIDVLDHAPGVQLKAILTPEHGLFGTAEGDVASGRDPGTDLPVYSLYGKTRRPTAEMLQGLDALVYDIQDVGVRFYTFDTTLGYCIEAAAQNHMPIYVLDRPDPLTGSAVEGPMLDRDQLSFVGYFPLPVRNGMTVGELAQMFNQENNIHADLHVIRMEGWQRDDWFDETELPWVDPSPNLRNLTETVLYPGLGMIEGANISVGRGTDTPFELLGAPWIDGQKLAMYLNGRRVQGVRFIPLDFTPTDAKFKGELCHGVSIQLLDRRALDSPELGVELAAALYKLFPGKFDLEKTLSLVGSRQVISEIQSGRDPRAIALGWGEQLQSFLSVRKRYLLY